MQRKNPWLRVLVAAIAIQSAPDNKNKVHAQPAASPPEQIKEPAPPPAALKANPLNPSIVFGEPAPHPSLPLSLDAIDVDLIRVRLDSNTDVGLYQQFDLASIAASTAEIRNGRLYQQQLICSGGCGASVDRRHFYQLRGKDLGETGLFKVPLIPTGELTVHVRVDHPGAKRTGTALLLSGALLGSLGLLAIGAGVVLSTPDDSVQAKAGAFTVGGLASGCGFVLILAAVPKIRRGKVQIWTEPVSIPIQQ